MMINILMATYNGEKYLAAQLLSILNQSYSQWKLYISDDNSTDRTAEIASEFMEKYPDKIVLLPQNGKSGGAAQNFFSLLNRVSDGEYTAFCDQDDVWLEDKLAKQLEKMQLEETNFGKNMPILVHSDLKVATENLSILNESFFDFQKISPNRTELRNYMVQNNVTGCTMLMNKALVDLVDFKPHECAMHDWWIALIAACLGRIFYVPEGLVLYRQHSKNEVGAKNAKSFEFIANKLKNLDKVRASYPAMFSQTELFLLHYGKKISADQKNILTQFIAIKHMKRLQKARQIVKYKFYKNSFLRTIGQFFFI